MAGGGVQLEMRIPVVARLKSTKFVTLSDVLAFNVIASYGARPPTLDEMTAVRSVSEGILYGNPDLGTEHMAGARGGLKWNAGILEGLLYYGYTHFESFIIPKPLEEEGGDPVYGFELCAAGYPCWIHANAGKADLHTLEFLNRLNIREFMTIGLLLNYANGTQENSWGEREPMSFVPPLGGAFWLRARYVRFGLWGEFSLRWAIDQNLLSTRDLHDPAICRVTAGCDGTDWYLLLAFRGGVRITNRFQLSFMFHNLMNRMQKTHGSLLYTPGIGASVSIEVRI
jgi:outer membrane receptor protein involved in Fe transport